MKPRLRAISNSAIPSPIQILTPLIRNAAKVTNFTNNRLPGVCAVSITMLPDEAPIPTSVQKTERLYKKEPSKFEVQCIQFFPFFGIDVTQQGKVV